MKKIDTLSKKLQDLQAEQQKLQGKIAEQLFAEIQKILGEDFSPSLALTLINQGWNHSGKSKEEWQKLSTSFQSAKP
ncbi:hypothetical protein [Candidatus Odyssella acanthamoebae]|uniref:Uncharacterized protein n=1 Tax=Candidatus Odyssella acanthamoebae TaxID=91604 RepID=A0A077AV44_9PROT|nr:hypothetical protein [Candidatus Paracaedibacter acanthamoebae]AIK96281.1 hypothetical protein ID47_05300 [Candidatus Paracaedibacter acanthamoebae]